MIERQDCCFCLLVDDYDKAIDFYCEKLGLFQVDADNDFGGGNRFVYLIFANRQFLFAIHLFKPTDYGSDNLIGRQAGNNLLAGFPIDDADATLARLDLVGVKSECGIYELPYGRQIIVKDCFGNRISLFQRYIAGE